MAEPAQPTDVKQAPETTTGSQPSPSVPAAIPSKFTITNLITWSLIVLFSGAILIFIDRKPEILHGLRDPAYARGLITFIICLASIGLAFMLVYQAFSQDSTDERFRRGREVFAGLMGVLGTIVGFYFGAAPNATERALKIATPTSSETDFITLLSGGESPYTVTLKFKGIGSDSSRSSNTGSPVSKPVDLSYDEIIKTNDGWVRHRFRHTFASGTVEVVAKDSKEGSATMSATIP